MTAVAERTLMDRVAAVLPVLHEEGREIDETAEFPVRGLAALRESGLMGLLVPEADGGLGGGLDELVEVSMELAGECLSTALVWGMHCQQVAAIASRSTRTRASRVRSVSDSTSNCFRPDGLRRSSTTARVAARAAPSQHAAQAMWPAGMKLRVATVLNSPGRPTTFVSGSRPASFTATLCVPRMPIGFHDPAVSIVRSSRSA